MHPYATDSTERDRLPLWFAGVAIVSAYLLSLVIGKSGYQDRLWWVEVPSVLGFYKFYFKLFDVWVWKCPRVRQIGALSVPDLSGTWDGDGTTLYDESGAKPFKCTVTIRQRWTRIRVWLDTPTSESSSIVGAITVEGRRPSLSYEYFNEPKALAPPGMNAHRGMTRLELIAPDELEGEYYSGRGRQTFGTLGLRRRK